MNIPKNKSDKYRQNAEYLKEKIENLPNKLKNVELKTAEKCHIIDLNIEPVSWNLNWYVETLIVKITDRSKDYKKAGYNKTDYYKKIIDEFYHSNKFRISSEDEKMKIKYLSKNIEKIFKNIDTLLPLSEIEENNLNVSLYKLFRNVINNIILMGSDGNKIKDGLKGSFNLKNFKKEDGQFILNTISGSEDTYKTWPSQILILKSDESLERLKAPYYAFICKMKHEKCKIVDHENKPYIVNDMEILEFLANGEIFKIFEKFEKEFYKYTSNEIHSDEKLAFDFFDKIFKIPSTEEYNFNKLLEENNSSDTFTNKKINKFLIDILKFCIKKGKFVKSRLKVDFKKKWKNLKYDPRRFRKCCIQTKYLKKYLDQNNYINIFEKGDFYDKVTEPKINRDGVVKNKPKWVLKKGFKFKEINKKVLNEAKIDKDDKNPGSEIERLEPAEIERLDINNKILKDFENMDREISILEKHSPNKGVDVSKLRDSFERALSKLQTNNKVAII